MNTEELLSFIHASQFEWKILPGEKSIRSENMLVELFIRQIITGEELTEFLKRAINQKESRGD